MKTNSTFAGMALAALISAGSFAQTVDEVIDKHVAAMGGMDKIKSVKTLILDRSVAVAGMEIPNKTTIVVGKSFRNESTIMGNSMVQVIDGTAGWMVVPVQMQGSGEPEDMPKELFNQQKYSMDPFGGLIDYKVKGNKVELIGKEKLGKKDVYHVKMTNSEGLATDQYLDVNTYLVDKVVVNANGQQIETELSDYKDFDGVKFPGTIELENPQAGRMSLIITKVAVNPNIDESIFKKPVK